MRMQWLPRKLPTERIDQGRRVERLLAGSSRAHWIQFPAFRSVRAIARASQPNRRPFLQSLREATASAPPVYPSRNRVSPELQRQLHVENGRLHPTLRNGDVYWSSSLAAHGIERSPRSAAVVPGNSRYPLLR